MSIDNSFSSSSEDSSSFDSYSEEEIDFSGKFLKNEYVIINKLGSGTFATVWIAYNTKKTNFYAIKIIDEEEYENGLMEIEYLDKIKKSKNPYINTLIEHFIYKENGDEHVCMVFELLACSLYDVINIKKYENGLPIGTVKSIIYQLLKALETLNNDLSLKHTDIKPENLLLCGLSNKSLKIIDEFKKKNCNKKMGKNKKNIKQTPSMYKKIVESLSACNYKDENKIDDNLLQINKIKIKLSDFGGCCESNDDNYSIQTRYYRAPEIILEYDNNEKSDIWSVGCVLFELLTGSILFNPKKDKRHNTDRTHIYLMESLLGKIPEHLINKSNRRVEFYTKSGFLKSFDKINYNPLSQLLIKKTFDKKDITNEEFLKMLDLLYKMFDYDTKKRYNVSQCLNHIWFK